MNIVIIGLSVTSSWGNGHATTYRSLIRGLAARGHQVLFLEHDLPWYAANRDQPQPAGARTAIYRSLPELFRFERTVKAADLVIVGSYVQEGIAVGEWVVNVADGIVAFYDIDTPVTVESLKNGTCEYLTPSLVRLYDLYLSFTGGSLLREIERSFGSPMARPLYCSVDTSLYRPLWRTPVWHLGYLGTWSADRQPALDRLLLQPAQRWPEGRFAVAGPQYPEHITWPENVTRTIHLSPAEHAAFYGSQCFTLNITRDAMKRAGFSPSVRLFEAAACGVPIISDWWAGLDTVFEPGREILLSSSADDTLRILRDSTASDRARIGNAARARILNEHTSEKRAMQLETYFQEARGRTRKAVTA